MAKGILKYDGSELEVEFDSMNYDNNLFDVYTVAICDPETDQIIEEEHYVTIDEYREALYHTYGREVMDEQEEMGLCDVSADEGDYEFECTYHVAYVIDHEEE